MSQFELLYRLLIGVSMVISGMALAVTSITEARRSTTRAPLAQAISAVVVAALGGVAIAAGVISCKT